MKRKVWNKGKLILGMLVVLASVTAHSRAAMTPVRLQSGSKIQLELAEQLKSGEAKEGQTVRYFVRGNVVDASRRIIVKDGAQAFGTVTKSKKKGWFGKKGKLEFTVDYAMAVDGTRIPLRTVQSAKGKSGLGNQVAGVLVFGPLGILFKGGNVVVKQGTMVSSYVDQDTWVKVWTPNTSKNKPSGRGKR